jgi:hypothetical protein
MGAIFSIFGGDDDENAEKTIPSLTESKKILTCTPYNPPDIAMKNEKKYFEPLSILHDEKYIKPLNDEEDEVGIFEQQTINGCTMTENYVGRCLCVISAIYMNFGIGVVYGSKTYADGVNLILNLIDENVFRLLMEFSELLPLIYPNDVSCDSKLFYEKFTEDKYALHVSTSLRPWLQNVFKSNTERVKKLGDYVALCQDVQATYGLIMTNSKALSHAIKYIRDLIKNSNFNDESKIYWKSLFCRAEKKLHPEFIGGVLVPSNYPTFCKEYELLEAVIIACNAMFHTIGNYYTGGGTCYSINPAQYKILENTLKDVDKGFSDNFVAYSSKIFTSADYLTKLKSYDPSYDITKLNTSATGIELMKAPERLLQEYINNFAKPPEKEEIKEVKETFVTGRTRVRERFNVTCNFIDEFFRNWNQTNHYEKIAEVNELYYNMKHYKHFVINARAKGILKNIEYLIGVLNKQYVRGAVETLKIMLKEFIFTYKNNEHLVEFANVKDTLELIKQLNKKINENKHNQNNIEMFNIMNSTVNIVRCYIITTFVGKRTEYKVGSLINRCWVAYTKASVYSKNMLQTRDDYSSNIEKFVENINIFLNTIKDIELTICRERSKHYNGNEFLTSEYMNERPVVKNEDETEHDEQKETFRFQISEEYATKQGFEILSVLIGVPFYETESYVSEENEMLMKFANPTENTTLGILGVKDNEYNYKLDLISAYFYNYASKITYDISTSLIDGNEFKRPMFSFDYLTIMKDNEPYLSRVVFDKIREGTVAWNYIVPIETVMNEYKMNYWFKYWSDKAATEYKQYNAKTLFKQSQLTNMFNVSSDELNKTVPSPTWKNCKITDNMQDKYTKIEDAEFKSENSRNFDVAIDYFDDSTENDIDNPDFNWIRYCPIIKIDARKFYLPVVIKWMIDKQFENADYKKNDNVQKMYARTQVKKGEERCEFENYIIEQNEPKISSWAHCASFVDKPVPSAQPPGIKL